MSYFLSLFVSHLDLHSLTHLFPTRRASDHPPVILVKGVIVICSGGLVGLPQALNSCPRAPSRLTQLGQVRRSPVSFTGSCVLIAMRCSAARFTTRSEEHTSELQSLMRISYAVFCLKKKKNRTKKHMTSLQP